MKTDPTRDEAQLPQFAQFPNDAQYSHTLYQNDLSALMPGSPGSLGGAELYLAHTHPSWDAGGAFRVIERGTGKYIETVGGSPHCTGRLLLAGSPLWHNYRFRAVITPLSLDDASPGGGLCGIVARFNNPNDYIALALDADGQLKLLQRRPHGFDVLDFKPLEFCLGQSLSLTLRVEGPRVQGSAGPYSGATHVFADVSDAPVAGRGRVGLIADVPARFGPFTIECTPAEAARIELATARAVAAFAVKRKRIPAPRLERTVPLRGLVSGRNLRIADVNGDGKPEIVVGQHSPAIAKKFSMTRLTCVSVFDLDGKLLWQSGVPDPSAPRSEIDLPVQVHDLFGDGGNVVVCVHGYDIQIRDGKSGKLLFSGGTPEMSGAPVGGDFKELTSNFGKPWGDESLSMDVASLAFCNTQGSTGAREILVKDDCHHLAVFDAGLQQLFRHRGNHGHCVWTSDLDGDGKDELVAGFSLIDDDGKRLWAMPLGGFPHSVAVADLLHADGKAKRLFVAAGVSGLFAVGAALVRPDVDALAPVGEGPAFRIGIAKFRADLPGLQLLTTGHGGALRLYDASLKQLWSKDFGPAPASAFPVNWTGKAEELILYAGGLIDGHGDRVVEALHSSGSGGANGPPWTGTSDAFSSGGRDSILLWDEQTLSVYVPNDAPAAPLYQPRRVGNRSTSSAAAQVSLPPDWR